MATGRCERYWWVLQWRSSEKAQTITASWKTASQEVWKETKHWPAALARCLPRWVGGGKGDSDLTHRRSTARRPEKELLNKDYEVQMMWCMSVLFLQLRAAETSRSDPGPSCCWNSPQGDSAHRPSGGQVGRRRICTKRWPGSQETSRIPQNQPSWSCFLAATLS